YQTRQTSLLARGAELRERLKAVEKAREAGSPLAVLMRLATPPQEKDSVAMVGLERSKEEQLFPLLLKEKARLHDYGEEHPEVLRVREQIAMTKEYFGRLDKVVRKGTDSIPVPTDPLEVQLLSLRQELGLVETSSAALNQLLTEEEKQARALEQ